MALYDYRAIDKSGKTKKGKIDAISIKQASSKVKSQGLHLLSISDSKERRIISKKTTSSSKKISVPGRVITGFTRQLSVLTSTGIPYDKALEVIIQESDHPAFQRVLSDIKAQIVEGSSLAGALRTQTDLFSKMYIAMIRAGEAGGTLSRVLEKLADAREENEDLISKIQGALIYPIIMSLMGIGMVTFMITFIIPKISPIFQQFNIELPLPTRIVIGTSDLVTNNWITIGLCIIAAVFTLRQLLKTRQGERLRDRFFLSLPILGVTINKIVVLRFSQTLATLLSSGVELKQSLEIVKYVVGNRVYEDRFDQIIADITRKGMDLSQAIRATQIFPLLVIQMIRVGEEASKLEEMLQKIASIQEKEVKQALDKAIALLEPITILGMAFMVGFIVLSVMLPMFKMNQLI